VKLLSPYLALVIPVTAGEPKQTVSTGNWEWTLSAGPSVRNIGTLKINAASRSSAFALPSLVGSSSLVTPSVGNPEVPADRTYDDGYVHQDAGTALDGSTWNWGYESPSQVQGDNLVYTATGSQSVLRGDIDSSRSGAYSRDSLRGFSPHLQLDGVGPRSFAGFRIGFSAGFDYTQVDQSLAFSDFAASQFRDDYRLDYVDTYALGGIIPPSAPYNGTYAGPGPLISNLPINRLITPVLLFTDTAGFSNSAITSIDMDVSSITLGPTLTRSWGPVGLAVQAGVILNVYQWEGRQYESLQGTNSGGPTTLAKWVDHDSGTKFRPGVYLQSDLTYDAGNHLAFGSFFRIDAASEFRAQAGPSTFKVDPSGFSAGFQVRYQLP
jgi:hypothetical protein